MVAFGLVLGGVASLPAGHAVRSFLFGVQSLDPLTVGETAFILLLVCGCCGNSCMACGTGRFDGGSPRRVKRR
jgi:hypothetical protein